MRSDYALYIVAIIFFVITGLSFILGLAEFERNVSVVTTTVLGLLFLGLGYTQRPKPQAPTIEAPTPTVTPEISPSTPATETVKEEKVETVTEVAMPKGELTQIKGIGAKRAQQLKALGISNVEDLAKASAKNLAERLKISPKITRKWIEDAKELIQKS